MTTPLIILPFLPLYTLVALIGYFSGKGALTRERIFLPLGLMDSAVGAVIVVILYCVAAFLFAAAFGFPLLIMPALVVAGSAVNAKLVFFGLIASLLLTNWSGYFWGRKFV